MRARSSWPFVLMALMLIWIATLVILIHRGPRLPPAGKDPSPTVSRTR